MEALRRLKRVALQPGSCYLDVSGNVRVLTSLALKYLFQELPDITPTVLDNISKVHLTHADKLRKKVAPEDFKENDF